MSQVISRTLKNQSIDTAFLEDLFGNRARISGNGDDPSDSKFWHKNALMVAAGLMKAAKTAGPAVSQAEMVLAAALASAMPSGHLAVRLQHVNGSTATIDVAISPSPATRQESAPARSPAQAPAADGEPGGSIWVALASFPPLGFENMVGDLARQSGLVPGSAEMDLACGALLTIAQACDAMHAARYTGRMEGFGSDAHQHDVVTEVGVTRPTPTLARRASHAP